MDAAGLKVSRPSSNSCKITIDLVKRICVLIGIFFRHDARHTATPIGHREEEAECVFRERNGGCAVTRTATEASAGFFLLQPKARRTVKKRGRPQGARGITTTTK
jgi:hypothetical protein